MTEAGQSAQSPMPEEVPIEVPGEAHPSISARIVDLATRHSALAVIVALASVMSSTAIVIAFLFAAIHRTEQWTDWQHGVEASIESLQAGYSIDYFDSKLGTPIISRAIANGYFENVYKGRGFYVEALTSGGTPEVKYFETVTCDTSITPHILLPGVGTVTLNRSSLASVSGTAQLDYSFGNVGADGLPYMREYDFGGTVGVYREFEWGINPSCTPNAQLRGIPVLDRLPHQLLEPSTERVQLAWVRRHEPAWDPRRLHTLEARMESWQRSAPQQRGTRLS